MEEGRKERTRDFRDLYNSSSSSPFLSLVTDLMSNTMRIIVSRQRRGEVEHCRTVGWGLGGCMAARLVIVLHLIMIPTGFINLLLELLFRVTSSGSTI